MCKKLFKALKIKMDNFHLKYELAGADETISQLKQQLAEKNKLLKQKISKMKLTDFIEMCIYCGFMVQAKEIDNQTAIVELEKVKTLFKEEFKDKWVEDCGVDYCEWSNYDTAINIINQQIKELKGEPKC